MVLPIPLGTVLRQRYLVQEVLGQGGFGRTYLALDQERFNDRCVVKEFIVPYHDGALIEKSKALFQREASILYQIQHPQVPRFWAAFEDDQRLFLVQDFVEGQTYRRLLSDRKQHGQAFSEAEVRHFLVHLLPVLSYIHDRDIVHRDVSPENIMLQVQSLAQGEASAATLSGLPVLIDFGAVKEATSHWPLMSTPTRVGKVGYAPPEQLQTGKVYPNSDLYALAASSLVLLTGREPQALLDSRTLTWRWEAYASLSEELGMILRKMLAVYPGDRYQSAAEVLTDLQPVIETVPRSTLLQYPPAHSTDRSSAHPVSTGPRTEQSSVTSRDQTPVAYVSRPESSEAFSPRTRTKTPGLSRLGTKPALQLGLAAAFIAALGIATPLLWQGWSSRPNAGKEVWVSGAKLPESEASRIIDAQGPNLTDAALRPRNSSDGVEDFRVKSGPPQQVQFPAGKLSTVLQGNLQGTNSQSYLLEAAQGQIMTASLDGSGVTMNLLRSNQEAIDTSAHRTRKWVGQLPANDRYFIQVSGSGAYALDLAISPLSPSPQEPVQRIAFAPQQTGTTVTGQISPRQSRRYLLEAKQGQTLVMKVLQGEISLRAIAPTGQQLNGSAANRIWQGPLPQDGDYVVEVSAPRSGSYALSLEVF